MSFLLEVAVVVVIVIVVAALVHKKATGSFWFFAKSQIGKAGRWAERQDPVAQMHQAAEEVGKGVGTQRAAIIKGEALVKMLDGQIANGQRDERKLNKKINDALDVPGAKPTDQVVKLLSEQLARVRQELANNTQQREAQLALNTSSVEGMLQNARKAKDVEKRADRLGVQLDMSESQRQLSELVQRWDPSATNNAVGMADKFERLANQKIAENQAAVSVDAKLNAAVAPLDDDDDGGVSEDAESALAEIMAKRAAAKQTTSAPTSPTTSAK